MRYLFIDDDEEYSRQVISILERKFPPMRGNIDLIASEKEFFDRLASPEDFNYAFIILDIMLRWSSASDESNPHPAKVPGGYLKAGVRILNALRKDPRGASLPIIIHTARGSERVEEAMEEWGISKYGIVVVRKWGDLHELVEELKKRLSSI